MKRAAFPLILVGVVATGTVLAPALLSDSAGRAGDRQWRGHSPSVDPETSCGPVSLAVVCAYLSRPAPPAELHTESGAGGLGRCSIADLIRTLEHRGLSARAVRYDPWHPPAHGLPMVLFVDGDHFLAAVPGWSDRVVLIDPPAGPRAVAWSELAMRWAGEAVVVGRSGSALETVLHER